MAQVRIKGLVKLQKKLQRFEQKDIRKVVTKVFRDAGKRVRSHARSKAPELTGALKGTMTVKALSRSRKRFGIMVRTGTRVELARRLQRSFPLSSKFYYPAVMEFGSKKRNIRARPYLRPAFERVAPNVPRRVRIALLRAARKP